MKILLSFLLLVVAGMQAQTSTYAQFEEARVLALESAWNQAVQLKDVKALAALFVDESVYIDDDGSVMNKAQYLASVVDASEHPDHILNESMRTHSYRNTVVVTGIYREKGLRKGKPYALRERFADTWIQHNGSWVCIASQSTPILP